MPRGIFNWSFDDVDRFLRDNGFRISNTRGSHFYYSGHGNGELRIVCVPFHGNNAIKPRTLKGIIKQSGITIDKWFKK